MRALGRLHVHLGLGHVRQHRVVRGCGADDDRAPSGEWSSTFASICGADQVGDAGLALEPRGHRTRGDVDVGGPGAQRADRAVLARPVLRTGRSGSGASRSRT